MGEGSQVSGVNWAPNHERLGSLIRMNGPSFRNIKRFDSFLDPEISRGKSGP